ncbi:hypothetical protein RZS08_61385, partial [Arthrospira platensis SPKY1]|nr:hypothetical protein [Arthrospira platensis SPKY1]
MGVSYRIDNRHRLYGLWTQLQERHQRPQAVLGWHWTPEGLPSFGVEWSQDAVIGPDLRLALAWAVSDERIRFFVGHDSLRAATG